MQIQGQPSLLSRAFLQCLPRLVSNVSIRHPPPSIISNSVCLSGFARYRGVRRRWVLGTRTGTSVASRNPSQNKAATRAAPFIFESAHKWLVVFRNAPYPAKIKTFMHTWSETTSSPFFFFIISNDIAFSYFPLQALIQPQ